MIPASVLENKTILVTGSAGFLAKVFVEKVLRIQPDVKKLYLLMRAPDSHSAAKRLRDEVTEKELFRVVKEKWGPNFSKFVSEKVVAVAGDVSREDLGIEDLDLKKEIWKEADLVVNFAATTRFDERAGHYGWPNTYTFTKAMGERIVMSLKGDLPLVILRPTIVTSTIKDPFPGWTEGVRTIDGFIVNYAKGIMKCLIERPETVYDLIPVDMVVNSIVGCICSAFQNQPLDLIYHLGSSRNALTSSDLRHLMFIFFSRNPWKDRHGRPMKANKWKTFSSFKTFQIYMTIRFLLPLKVLCLVNAALCHRFEAMCGELDRKLKVAMRLVKLYEPYLLFVGIFDDTNLEKLRARGSQNGWWDAAEMNMNAGSIDWSDYIMNVHIPGLIRFVKF
ncbi:unnamed protein product [Linum tenue]|uniref:Fatty acyl-CoA reductase n=1 Tax=Linum tenue TaxID=586396 RepID=A0AAV0RAX3_9ROSI|nr:unnamed protein product [Linum tenue]